jgi:UDP-N-acetylmuramate dehydrogenase
MESSHQFSLKNHNSFYVNAICPSIFFPKSIDDLADLPDLSKSGFYIIGEGSNTLFIESHAPIIIKPEFLGVEVVETPDSYIVSVGAGENWHDLVCSCLAQGILGLENLALIPGSVGAAPVQNIGAYGVELSDYCTQVKWFDLTSKTVKTLSNSDCQFSYRNSIFKGALYNKGIIIEVVFKFPKSWQANVKYAGLHELNENPSAQQVMDKVIAMRQKKLPDPSKLPNAGSFFKNPIVSQNTFTKLNNKFINMPYYLQSNGQVKLAAGWLIEQAGLKGYSENGVGVHAHQALVLVNYNSENGSDIVALAKHVQARVLAKFDIVISPEVRMVGQHGEQEFSKTILKTECK